MAKINFVTKSLTTSNRVRINLYKEPDRTTVIDSLDFAASHPQRTWTFYDLIPSQDYYFRWTEIDGSALDIQTYAEGNFTVPAAGSIEIKEKEELLVDLTPGVVSGQFSATLDGTSGKPDFRGWEIIPFEIGTGPMQKDQTYTWNSTTGVFTRLDRAFEESGRYPIMFEPRVIPVSNVVIVRDAWSANFDITNDITLTAAHFSKNGIIKGSDGYLKITLPDIFSVTPNKLLYLDSTTGSHKCAEITCSAVSGNGNLIQWPFPNKQSLFMGISETLAIYREKVSNTVSVWRVKFPDGNYKTVGEIISEYADNIINKVALDDTLYDIFEYARLYDYVQNLPETVAFADWSTGNNKYKFSLANGSNKFHVPDLRNKYLRASGDATAGTYQANMFKAHTHDIKYILEGNDGSPTGAGEVLSKFDGDGHGSGQGGDGTNSYAIQSTGGTETRPETVVVNMCVRC